MKKVAFSTGAFYTLETADALAKIRKAGFPHAELMPQCQEDLSPVMLRKTEQIGIHILPLPRGRTHSQRNAIPRICQYTKSTAKINIKTR